MKTQASLWIGREDSDEYWAEGEKAVVEVEVTDADEVRVGAQLSGEDQDAVTIYLSRDSADKLARFLFAASVAEVNLPVG